MSAREYGDTLTVRLDSILLTVDTVHTHARSPSDVAARARPLPPLPLPLPAAAAAATTTATAREKRSKSASPPPACGERARDVLPSPIGKITLGEVMFRDDAGSPMLKGLVETGEVVAVKRVNISAMSSFEFTSIMAEIELMKRLSHPSIVRIYGQYECQPHLYLFLEYLENGPLSGLIKEFGSLPENLVVVYTVQILHALAYLHAEGIIHRDLKAANIYLNKAGNVKIAEFGAAAELNKKAKHFSMVGSPYWMAPEVIEILGHSAQSDIWSLGAAVYELLTGMPPFYGIPPMMAMFKIVHEDIPEVPDVSPYMTSFLNLCFTKDPDLRPSATMLLGHLLLRNVEAPPMDMNYVKQSARVHQRTKSLRSLSSAALKPAPTAVAPSVPAPAPAPAASTPAVATATAADVIALQRERDNWKDAVMKYQVCLQDALHHATTLLTAQLHAPAPLPHQLTSRYSPSSTRSQKRTNN
eukprot:TRINITY_DN2256_c0_g1_i1.p1 TRINITY_DN2256_c0_g1~~TRINITY_DN2256_c0_g1_i1.p1  ORF type:complete len:471 (-),score=132.40 TRINITY_DN2256_c0_g1_i1:673-2085(-)